MTGKNIEWTEKRINIPKTAINHALASNGASASASATAAGFDPGGAINGNRTLAGWGKGNGWQAPTPAWHPNWWGEWLEVTFSGPEVIDAVIVYTYPALVKNRLWRGLKSFQVQCLKTDGERITLKTIANNTEDFCVIRFDEIEAHSVRIVVTRNHYPEESGFESGFTYPDESPRILELEAYRLGDVSVAGAEKRSLSIEAGENGNVALFCDRSFAEPSVSIPAAVSVLRSAGYGVTLLDAGEVSEPSVLNSVNFDFFIHPYGKYVPIGINIFDFLRTGGHLVTFGGRAFTAAKQREGDEWRDLDMDPGITASTGRYNDSIRPYREQLGIFSIPNSRLRHVSGFRTADGQFALKGRLDVRMHAEGWMAYGHTGELIPPDESAGYASEGRMPRFNHEVRQGIRDNRSEEEGMWGMNENIPQLFSHPCARWIPLLEAYDEYGRHRGPAAALMTHFEGVYRGSSWAFFGIENVDLLLDNEFCDLLPGLLEHMSSGVCMHGLEPEYSCYRQGEDVRYSLLVDNWGINSRELEIKFFLERTDNGRTTCTESVELTLQPGEWKRIERTWSPAAFDCDLYRIRAVLYAGGEIADTLENGFAVWDEKIVAQGPKVEFKDNYFHFDGVPRYVIGARDSGLHLPGQPDENPLGWDRQYRGMSDYGMRITSPIHIDHLIPGLGWGRLDAEKPVPEVVIRRMDAQVQLAQKYGLIFEPGLFFVYENQAIKDLDTSRAICEYIGKRYSKAPGIIFCLLDDCMKHVPEVFNRWAGVCADALNSGGRKYMITAEFGFRQEWPDTLRHGSIHLTFNSGSCFQKTVGDPVFDRLVDMRPAGKSFTYGEFVRRIPGGVPEDFYGYMAPPHLNFGMGYAMVMNWKWHTGIHTIWPSDVIFPDNLVPKDHLPAFRNEALFFGRFKPCYRTPPLLVVLPSSIWLKYSEAVTRYLVAFLRRLIELKADFACIDDTDLDLLTDETRALIYPIPMEMSDEVYSRLCDFAGKGGSLLITGDICRLPDDVPGTASRTGRLTELCGLNWKGFAFSGRSKVHSLFMDGSLPGAAACDSLSEIKTGGHVVLPWINAEPSRGKTLVSDEKGQPLAAVSDFGRGSVWFTQDMEPELPHVFLAEFLKASCIDRNKITPDLPELHCFRTDTQNGSVYTVLTFPWDRSMREVCIYTKKGKVELLLKDQVLGMVHADDSNGINALETQGNASVDGEMLIETDAHVMLSSLDDKDLRHSSAIILLPVAKGNVKLMNRKVDTVEKGIFDGGRWNCCGLADTVLGDGYVSFNINALDSTLIYMAYESNNRDGAAALIEKCLAPGPD